MFVWIFAPEKLAPYCPYWLSLQPNEPSLAACGCTRKLVLHKQKAEMKRIVNILFAMLLSLMLVYLGGGATILTCCHDNSTQMAEGDGCCQKSCDCCPMTSCMETTVVKLSPTVTADKAKAKVPQAPMHDLLFVSLFYYFQPTTDDVAGLTAAVQQFHSPPREYLTLMRVLRL